MSDDRPDHEIVNVASLQATLNVIPGYTWYASSSGGLTFVNKRTGDYLGLPTDHPLRLGIDTGAAWDAHIAFLHPDDHDETRNAWSTCLRSGEAGEASFRVRDAEGGYRWFLSRAEPLRASDGNILQWVGVNLDVEDLKRAELALRDSELKLREIIDTVPSMLWSAASDGEPTGLNQRILDYSGLRLEHFLNLGWKEFIHQDDFPETARAFFHAIQTGGSYEVIHRLRRADGQYRWHHARGEPLRDKHQRVIQWYGIAVDIDDAKKAEDELRATQTRLARASQAAAVAELSASIAHEINQPLASIVASAQTCQNWLSSHDPDLPKARTALERIIRDGNAAADIVRHIRALFRQTTPAKTPLNINAVIEEVRRLTLDEMKRRGVSIDLDLIPALPVVPADRIQIQQVLINLIRNGVDAMEDTEEPARRLIVRSQLTDNGILVEVCDHGSGLKQPDKIFEPFYSTKPNGLGVGLAISRSIVLAHGGILQVRNNEPRGSVFSLSLPGREIPDDAQSELVIIVEDDFRVREAISGLLASRGIKTVAFESAAEYLQFGHPNVASCLILDMSLPDINGLDLQNAIAQLQYPPIIFISGHGDISASVRAMKAGAVDFLTKPINEQGLLQAIEAALIRDRGSRRVRAELSELDERYATLTPREREVLPLVVSGLLNKQAAAELGISEVTLQIHRSKVMQKMRARSIADLVRITERLNIPVFEINSKKPS